VLRTDRQGANGDPRERQGESTSRQNRNASMTPRASVERHSPLVFDGTGKAP
jgi:hypothetical protein